MADIKDLRDRGQYGRKAPEDLPGHSTFGGNLFLKQDSLRYGENPPAYKGEGGAATFVEAGSEGPGILTAERLQVKKEISYNNVQDADRGLRLALRLGYLFPQDAIAVLIKHKGPCGVARASTVADAHDLAYSCYPMQAFGGVNIYLGTVDADAARLISAYFNEVVVAPDYTDEALGILAAHENLRVLRIGNPKEPVLDCGIDEVSVLRGRLAQKRQVSHIDTAANLQRITDGRDPTPDELEAALFLWPIAFYTPSNAVIIGDKNRTVGIGKGQGSRIDSAELAVNYSIRKAKTGPKGYQAASDAFFPEIDAPKLLGEVGVSAVVFPLGSKKDAEVIQTLNKYGVVGLCTRPIAGEDASEEDRKQIERGFSH